MDTETSNERLETEISLLEAMYPGQVEFESRAREVNYVCERGTLKLRLPDEYLQNALPVILVAVARTKVDLRDVLKDCVERDCILGEEVLDTIISAFYELAHSASLGDNIGRTEHPDNDVVQVAEKATMVVWLHHLLNTNKRKLAISPPSPDVAGVTKPGYPGVLVYSGPADAVHQHIGDLKQQNWQAFQVRLEIEEQWVFAHGSGVLEVETMKDVFVEIGEDRKDIFMEAMRMK